jgi:hypothetical protein
VAARFVAPVFPLLAFFAFGMILPKKALRCTEQPDFSLNFGGRWLRFGPIFA